MASTRPRWHCLWPPYILLATLYAIGDIPLSDNNGGQVTTRSDLIVRLLIGLAECGLTLSSRTLEVVVAGLNAVMALANHTWWYSYHFVEHHWATIGLIAGVMYILVNHGAVLWYKVLPIVVSHVRETNFWPWPLRRRSFRRRLYRKYGDAMWAILAFLVFVLMLSNSATKPSTTADKWFAKTSAQLPVHRTATKQSDANVLPSNNHFSSPPLQLQASLDTATSDATLGMQRLAEDGSRQANAANTASPQHMQPLDPAAKLTTPAMPDVMPGSGTALMKAQSRAVMLLPVWPICPANYMVSKTVLEAPHMIVVRPLRIPAMLAVLSAHAVPQLVTQPLPAIALVSSISSDAASDQDKPDSTLLRSMRSPNFLDLKSWTPLRKLLLAAFMFSLGVVYPGLQLWLKGGGDTLAAGAAMAPAESEDPMSLKIERFGKKAGRALKRTSTSLISTRWTGDHATTPSVLPSPAPPSPQQGQHSLLDADSILPHDASTLTDAAARDPVEDSISEAPLPAAGGGIPPVRAASHDDSAAPAEPASSLHAPAVELPIAEEPAPAADCPEQPAPISHEVQPAAHVHAASAQPAPAQPTAAVEPAQHSSASPLQAQPATPLKPDVETPTRVPFLADSTPKAALPAVVPRVPLRETSPAAVANKHSLNTLSADCSIGDRSGEDKVVSNGCLGFFGCFKCSGRRKRGNAGTRRQ